MVSQRCGSCRWVAARETQGRRRPERCSSVQFTTRMPSYYQVVRTQNWFVIRGEVLHKLKGHVFEFWHDFLENQERVISAHSWSLVVVQDLAQHWVPSERAPLWVVNFQDISESGSSLLPEELGQSVRTTQFSFDEGVELLFEASLLELSKSDNDQSIGSREEALDGNNPTPGECHLVERRGIQHQSLELLREYSMVRTQRPNEVDEVTISCCAFVNSLSERRELPRGSLQLAEKEIERRTSWVWGLCRRGTWWRGSSGGH